MRLTFRPNVVNVIGGSNSRSNKPSLRSLIVHPGTFVRLLILSLSIGGVSAVQAAMLDFGIIAPTTGNLSYAGGATPLVGSGIQVDNVVGLGTPSNNTVTATCTSCTLGFQTGASTGGWNFGAGGTITITGGVDFPDATPDIGGPVALLQGTMTSATIVDLGNNLFEFQIVGAAFTDTKHPDLLAFYGLPNISYVGALNISFSTTANVGDGFSTDVILSGDVVNQPVPIPPAVWLFGSGLVGLAGIARRRRAD